MKKQRVSVVASILTVEYPAIGKVFKADISKYPEAMRQEAEKHGWKQKFGDAESGKSAQEKYDMVCRMHEGIMSGQWELTAKVDMTPAICEAVARIKKIPLEKVRKVAEAKPETVKEWGANPKVKAEIAKARAEKAAKLAAESKDEINIEI